MDNLKKTPFLFLCLFLLFIYVYFPIMLENGLLGIWIGLFFHPSKQYIHYTHTITKTEKMGCLKNMAEINWHGEFIPQLAKIFRPKVYVELGIFNCILFNRVVPFAEQLLGVDVNERSGDYMIKSSKTRFFHGTTEEFAKELKANPLSIDMLFIDADHSKNAVLEDFRNFFPFVSEHGLILLHDTHPGNQDMMNPAYCGTAYQAIEELSKDTSCYELMTIPVNPGLTICRKRKNQLSWHEI